MFVAVVLVALAAEDVVDEGLERRAAFVVVAAAAASEASEIKSWMLPKPKAKFAAEELALLQ